jgi:hypothetical protein
VKKKEKWEVQGGRDLLASAIHAKGWAILGLGHFRVESGCRSPGIRGCCQAVGALCSGATIKGGFDHSWPWNLRGVAYVGRLASWLLLAPTWGHRDSEVGKCLIRVFLSGLSRLWKNVLFMLKSMREKSRNDILW